MSGNAGTASQLIDPYTGAQYGIVTRLMDRYRTHPEDLANVPLVTLADPLTGGGPSSAGRTPILLRDVAKVSLSSEPLQISRKNQQRVIDVTANVVNRPLGAVSAEIVQRLDRLSWPAGFTYYMAGQTEQQQGAFGSLGREAGLQAGRIRLRPILMTALATILGMIPMALGLGEGSETNMPLARTVIGGLSVSTFLTLFLIPILYVLFERRGHRHETVAG